MNARSQRRAGFLAFPVLVLLASTAAAAPVIVDNPATPPGGATVVTPAERWRVGGESESEDEFFGVVRQAAMDAAGNTYLLDQQLHEVRVFDADGRFVRSFGRQGEGPGELSMPQDLVVLPDGRVGVLHGRPGRLTFFSQEGGEGTDVTLGDGEPFAFSLRAEVAGARPVVQRSITTMGDGTLTSTQSLVALDPQTGEVVHTYAHVAETMENRAPAGSVMIIARADAIVDWACGSDGRVYVVRSIDRYEIEVHGPDGTHERTIWRAYERVAKPKPVLDAERASRRAMAERFGRTFDENEIALHYPDIDALFVRPNGELWVLPSEGRRDEDPHTLGVFDVFDAEGRLTRQVEVRVPFVRGRDEFSFEGTDLVVFEDSLDAVRSGAAGGGFVFNTIDDSDRDEDEVEALEIVRYSMP